MSEQVSGQGRRDWHVFETIVADGSWAIGIAQGVPNPAHVMVVADHLTRVEAIHRAEQRAAERGLGSPELDEPDVDR